MNIGVINEDVWDFFQEIYDDFRAHHQVSLFQRHRIALPVFNERLNERLLTRSFRAFLGQQNVVFFEWAGELLARASHMPKQTGLVTRIHRYDLYRWLDSIKWEALDRIILVSEAKRREFARRFPENSHKVVVIPEGVCLDKFAFQPKPFTGQIGILCHLTARKRVYDLILDFYEAAQQRPDLHLWIGGDERPLHRDYHEAMQTLVKKLNMQTRVTFQGHIKDNQRWYKEIDIFISHSYSEGLQVSPMEAMASGVYCLSHHWDGADELLPADNLYLTGGQFQEKLLTYADLPESERQLRLQQLHQWVSHRFDINGIKSRIRAITEEVGRLYQ